jgi:replication factor C subunit 3/5
MSVHSVNITEDGRTALLRLSRGDMRRALNILQATCAAYDVVNEQHIYACTGNPEPKDVEQIVEWLLNKDFDIAFQCMCIL